MLLATAKARGFSVHVYRPAWIGGHSLTGACALEHQHLFLLIKGCIQMGYAPDWQMELNILPVDFISKFVSLVSINDNIKERVFNLVNSSNISWIDLISWINNYGHRVAIIPKNEWRIKHLSKINKHNALYSLIPLYISGETSKNTQEQIKELKIRNTNTINVSKTLLLTCPLIDDNILEVYFRFLYKTNFLESPNAIDFVMDRKKVF